MFRILEKKILADEIKLFKMYAPGIAQKAKPGQFIILRINEKGERIPLTIADFDQNEGTITIVFQEVGKTTKMLGLLEEGDTVLDFVGPLGMPSHVEEIGKVVCVGGGVGVAPIYPITRALKGAGNDVTGIIGARSKNILFWEDEMRSVTDRLFVTTDDGSHGRKGFVTDILKGLIDEDNGRPDLVVAVGPLPMMKAVSMLTREFGIKTVVSLNSIMVDGTGMCGACRVTVGDETRFACVDGPEFDGHKVNFDEMSLRAKFFEEEEKQSMRNYLCSCGGKCND
ncbi:MAG TPA: sulfide/dihydroorotate dehydrogenase-like FAD/NAD-binding protein [Clostridia bacterium]|nr:sulfide/dihydroorotate dehydrogenase-like FAD/NAD-binding protein [Clostridia bacterium]